MPRKQMTMSDVGDDNDHNDATFDEGRGEDSDEDSDDVPVSVKSLLPRLEPAKEIKNEMAELRLEDDRAFVKQLTLDPCFPEVTIEMFENATDHVWVKHDQCKQSLFIAMPSRRLAT